MGALGVQRGRRIRRFLSTRARLGHDQVMAGGGSGVRVSLRSLPLSCSSSGCERTSSSGATLSVRARSGQPSLDSERSSTPSDPRLRAILDSERSLESAIARVSDRSSQRSLESERPLESAIAERRDETQAQLLCEVDRRLRVIFARGYREQLVVSGKTETPKRRNREFLADFCGK